MAICDFVIEQDILGYDCENPPVKGVESVGLLLNRSDIGGYDKSHHTISLRCGNKKAYQIVQSGKTPFNGTQQEMQEGANANTITNTLQIVVLKQDENWAEQLHALVNGEFVAVLTDKLGNHQVYGLEAGLHCTGAVRELYNDDNLSGWQITFTEEGAAFGNYFITNNNYNIIQQGTAPCV